MSVMIIDWMSYACEIKTFTNWRNNMFVIKQEYHPNGALAFEEIRAGHRFYYNEQGKKIREEFLNQVNVWDYNEDGLLIHWKYAFGKDCWRDYDENNRLVREWQDGGYDGRWEYDENGRVSRFYDITNTHNPCWYAYDDSDKLIRVCESHDEYVKLISGEDFEYIAHEPVKQD